MTQEMKYRAYTLHNYKEIPQIENLSPQDIEAIEVVGRVLPFKANLLFQQLQRLEVLS